VEHYLEDLLSGQYLEAQVVANVEDVTENVVVNAVAKDDAIITIDADASIGIYAVGTVFKKGSNPLFLFEFLVPFVVAIVTSPIGLFVVPLLAPESESK